MSDSWPLLRNILRRGAAVIATVALSAASVRAATPPVPGTPLEPAITSGAESPAAASPAVVPERLDMFVGDIRILDVASRRVAVGNGGVLSVSTLDRGQLLLLAEQAGTTTVTLWLRSGARHRITVSVTEASLDVALENVRKMLEGTPNVAARIAGTRIVLEGDLASDAEQRRAAAIVDAMGGQVVNFVGRVGWEQMLHFDVRIVEIRRSAIRDLGIRWDAQANGPAIGVIADAATNPLFRVAPAPSTVPGVNPLSLPLRIAPPATYAGITSVLSSRIDLLEQRGDAFLVAQPTLSCRSGGSARFVSGGEFPIPVVDGRGSTDVEFKEYGVILDVKPVTDRGGSIFARVDTEISQIDESVTVLGVPGLLKRRSTTELNLREGEVAVLAGLVSRTRAKDVQQVPGLGAVPLLGTLFKSTARRNAETEVLILITPRVVRHDVDSDALARNPVAEGVVRGRELVRQGNVDPADLRLSLRN